MKAEKGKINRDDEVSVNSQLSALVDLENLRVTVAPKAGF